MQNPMHFVSVHDIQMLSTRQAVIIIDLNAHVHLRDPETVQDALDAYFEEYPRFEAWEARVTSHWLYVKVTGDINPAAFARYSR